MKFTKLALVILSISLFSQGLIAQCTTWANLDNREYLEGQHSVYRGLVKSENYTEALAPWKTVYEAAPAADGKRDFHYTDGITIYKALLEKEADAAKKQEYIDIVLRLYDEAIACYEAKAISLKGGTDEVYATRISDLYARKGYDMYYYFRTPYPETMTALQESLDKGGMNAPYTVIAPYADIAVYQFTNEAIDKAEARQIHDALIALAEENESNGNQYATYYTQAKEAAIGKFREIEDYIFDCDYFKELWMPEYEENKDDPQYAKDLYNKLRQRGCEDGDPFLDELKKKYEVWAAAENARIKAEYEANNPGIQAKKAYDAGDFDGAIAKYRDAISNADSNDDKASYHFSIASILFRKKKQYGTARSEARTAAELRPNWGRPYMLIGDMYATGARNCGDSWNQRLAILAAVDKYSYAKSIDPEVADEADNKIGRYRSSYPMKDEGFMRGVKAGQSQTVGCWIGETVKVRFQ